MKKKILIFGGDGYLGWSLGLYRAFHTDDEVILIDSYLKRDLQKKVGIQELYVFPFLSERIRYFNKKTGKTNLSGLSVDATDYNALSFVLQKYQPDVIINAAQQPSAPFSMMSPENAAFTLTNNEKTCLNVLWGASVYCPDATIINVGSAGVFQSIETNFISDEKENLFFKKDEKSYEILNSWLPMQASDFYHQSKVHTFGITEMCTKLWDLRTITVQQSIIFGQCSISELDIPDLYSRFNYDHIFGTVLNRFVCQAVLGHPLSVYGDGSSQTNVICLCNTIDVFNGLIDLEIERGNHKALNNFTSSFNILSLAQKVIEIYGKGEINHITDPRKEVKCDLVKNFAQYKSSLAKKSIECSISETLDFAERFKYNINSEQFKPTVSWMKSR